MRITCALLLAFFSLSLFGCETAEEKAVRARIAELDIQLERIRPRVTSILSGMERLQSTVQPAAVGPDTSALSKEESAVFRNLNTYSFRFLYPDKDDLKTRIVPRDNTLGLWLNPDANDNNTRGLIQFLRFVDPQQIFGVAARLSGDDWPSDISAPSQYHSEARRDEDAEKMREIMEQLTEIRYLIGAEEKLVVAPRMVDDNSFESGILFAKLHVLDVQSQEIVETFYAKALNSGLTYTMTEDYKNEELLKDLRSQLFVGLRQRLKADE